MHLEKKISNEFLSNYSSASFYSKHRCKTFSCTTKNDAVKISGDIIGKYYAIGEVKVYAKDFLGSREWYDRMFNRGRLLMAYKFGISLAHKVQ